MEIYCFSLIGNIQGFANSILDDDDFDDLNTPVMAHRSRRSTEESSSFKEVESLIPTNYSIHEPPPTNNSETFTYIFFLP